MLTDIEIKLAKRKWWDQRQSARRRGIEFDFSFESWLQFWLDSGHWYQRGIKSADSYVMSRFNDTGPYRLDNVVIKSNRDNVQEGNIGQSKPGSAVVMTCLHCRYPVSANNRERHWGGQRCKEKKAPRYRVL
jgi:hypothetical protein